MNLNFIQNNVILIGVLTYIATQLRSIFNWIFRIIMIKYSMALSIDGPRNTAKAIDLLCNLTPYKHSKEVLMRNIRIDTISDMKTIANGLYIVKVKPFCWVYTYAWRESAMNNTGAQYYVHMYIIGFGRKEIHEKLVKEYIDAPTEDTLELIGGSNLDIARKVPFNPNKRIFGSAVKKVDTLIEQFVASKDIYRKFNRAYKMCLLLHGKPGTGKSTMLTHIANKLGSNKIYFINEGISTLSLSKMGMFGGSMFLPVLYDDASKSDKPILLVIEDIDRSVLGINAEVGKPNLDNDDKEFKPMRTMINHGVVDSLLQFLDSVTSPNNVIICITTNNPQLIPEQIMRKGRIHHEIHVDNLTYDEAKEMCEYYGVDHNTHLPDKKAVYNPSELENKIFDSMLEERMSNETAAIK